ncbi:MAG: HAD-IA family hydrolase [Rhodobacteraceae bacterium]|nr:HAD-IA family hydrolase [Paracoccaceae bacterium]
MSGLAALIFDVDGTLAETEEAHRAAFNAAFAAAGLGWHWSMADYGRLLTTTGGKERMARWREERGSGPSDATIAALHGEKTARYAALMAGGGLMARPGVLALVAAGRAAGLRLAVATTTSPGNVEALTQALWGRAAGDVFDVVAAGDEVAAKKPAPDVYALALRRLGLPAAAALAFEDSRNGVLSARGAGLRVVVTPSAYTAGEDFAGASEVLADLTGFDLTRWG